MQFVNQTQLEAPFLLEHDHESITIAWIPPTIPVNHYELEISHEEGIWSLISSTIKHNLVKKKNLSATLLYRFRVRFEDRNGDWSPFSTPSEPVKLLPPEICILEPPTLLAAELNALTVQWKEVANAHGYHLRFRKDNELTWQVIETEIKGNKAKKKGLVHGNYYFSVQPTGEELKDQWSFSLAGGPFATIQFHPYFQKMLPSNLLKVDSSSGQLKQIDTNELAGKTIGLYFSAHWCGPCRNFTPQLAQLYLQAQSLGKKFEIIFVSCDHTENDFKTYFFGSMPWTAIEFDDAKREEMLASFRVSSIPKLTILSSSGKVIEDNAAHHAVTIAHVDEWIKNN